MCHKMAFVGVTDSFESYYQAVRRCWRFGQKNRVDVHIFSTDKEGSVVKNLERKETDARHMADAMALETLESVRESVIGRKREYNPYEAHRTVFVPSFLEAV
ncbi:hypothetical protein CCP4SC76_310004 [Gammaproteobacteria bacterium]